MDKNLALQGKNIWKTYGEDSQPTLKGVDFYLRQGEILGLVGVSGCGKSTLAQIASGILDFDHGSLLVFGKKLPLLRSKGRNMVDFPLQMVFQNALASFNNLYPLKDSLIEAQTIRSKADFNMDEIKEVLQECDLPLDSLEKHPYELSGGQIQRMAIARAILSKPKVLIADEITSALDLPLQLHILYLLRRMAREKNLGLLIISHDIAAISKVADRVLVMAKGEIVFEGRGEELMDDSTQEKNVRELIESSRLVYL